MVEIERKFLVKTGKWKPGGAGLIIKQGYLSVDPERAVRVRLAGHHAFLTIKGKQVGFTRTELEYNIPVNEAEILLGMCIKSIVEKTRYIEIYAGNKWEIDVFEGVNAGLIMAEIELENENQEVSIPDWAGQEVSGIEKYYNSSLSVKPFLTW
jgi:adenylate cyclase